MKYIVRRGRDAGSGGYWARLRPGSWGFVDDRRQAETFDCRCWPERIVRNLKKDNDPARVVKLVAAQAPSVTLSKGGTE